MSIAVNANKRRSPNLFAVTIYKHVVPNGAKTDCRERSGRQR
jgi:hypothetical protein